MINRLRELNTTMGRLKLILFAAIALTIVGCTGSTAVSRQPSTSEIEEGKQRRLKAIDELQIPEDQKQRMREQVTGKQQERKAGN